MALLILGLVLFLGTHAFTMAREPRAALVARLGEGPYKGLYSLLSVAGVVLIAIGFGRDRAGGHVPASAAPGIGRPDTSRSGTRRSGRGTWRFSWSGRPW